MRSNFYSVKSPGFFMGPGILSDGGTGAGGHSDHVDRIVVDEKTESLTNRRPFLVLLATQYCGGSPWTAPQQDPGHILRRWDFTAARQEKGHQNEIN